MQPHRYNTFLIKIVFLVVLAIGFNRVQGQQASPFLRNTSFDYGEKLVYKLSYSLWINVPVAEVTMSIAPEPKVMKGRDHFLIEGIGKSYKFYNSFFKVHDIYKSYIDVESFEPAASVRIVNEGSYHSSEFYVYNHKKGYLKNRDGKTFNIPEMTQDILSSIYLARTFDYEKATPGDSFMINVFIDDSTYLVGVKYDGKEVIEMNGKKYSCLKLKPILIVDRVFKTDEDMTLWVSDDKNHIPVRVYSGISVGAVKAELYQYENLRYGLNISEK